MKLIAAAMIAVMLAGCTVMNPHVAVPGAMPSGQAYAGELGSAIAEADQLRRTYHRAVGEQTLVRNGLALTLIPLSAASLAVGITSAGNGARNFLAGAGAGGAALFGLGSLFLDQAKQRVFLAGERALTCAILAMRPALVPVRDFVERQTTAATLGRALADAEGAADPALLQQARTMLATAHVLLARIDASGFVLRQQEHAINADVSDQLSRTEPDLQSIMAVAGSLQARAKLIAPGFPTSAAAVPRSQSARSLSPDAADRLRAAMDQVAPWLQDAAALERTFSDLIGCTPNGIIRLRLLLAADVLDVRRGDVVLIPVQPSGLIPAVAVTGATGVTATPEIRGGAVVIEVKAAANASPGDRTITVADPLGELERSLIIRVSGATAPGGMGPQGRSPQRQGPGPAAPTPATPDAEMLLLQPPGVFAGVLQKLALFPTQVTGRNNPAFRDRVKTVQESCFHQAATGIVDQQFLTALAARKAAADATACPLEAD